MFEYFVPVFYTLLQLIVLIVIGYVLKRFGSWPDKFFGNVSRLLVRIALPLYQFAIVAKTDSAELKGSWSFFAASLVFIFVGIAVARLAVLPLPVSSADKRLVAGFSGFGNAGYIPLSIVDIMPVTMPALAAYFGRQIPAFYISIYVLCQSPLLWTVGNYLVTGRGKKPRLQELISPPMMGIAAGLLFLIPGLNSLTVNPRLPTFHMFVALERLGRVAIPLILVCLGTMIADIKLKKIPWREYLKLTFFVMGLRFFILPGLFFAAYLLFFRKGLFSPAQYFVLFLQTSNPPATNLSIMASQAGINEDKVAFTLMTTYLAYLVVLPLYLLLFLSLPGILP